jgi:hypothetical protein
MTLDLIVLKASANADHGITLVLVPDSNSANNNREGLIGGKVRLDFAGAVPDGLDAEGEKVSIEIPQPQE